MARCSKCGKTQHFPSNYECWKNQLCGKCFRGYDNKGGRIPKEALQ